MFSLGGVRRPVLAEFNAIVDRFSLIILFILLAAAALQKYLVLSRTDGGADLLYADIPKSLMLLKGQNPYSVQPWASPYPPFFLIVLGGIIQATSGQTTSSAPVGLISRNIMLMAVLADLIVGTLIFATLKRRGFSGLQVLLPMGVFLLLPSISTTPYFFFHSDLFGYPILAASLLSFASNRLFTGSTLLAVSTIFKIHPLLAIPLMMVWIVKREGLLWALPSLISCSLILSVGLLVPFWIPGYADALLGFNLSNISGTTSFSIMNLFYGLLPAAFGVSLSPSGINEVWIIVTTTLLVLVLGEVWRKASSMDALDVVLLGLLVWLLPLRQLYTHYIVWAAIPFLMRGKVVVAIVAGGIIELANTMAVWSWNVPPNPFPAMNSVYGFFLTSLVYSSFGIFAVRDVLKGSVRNASSNNRPTSVG